MDRTARHMHARDGMIPLHCDRGVYFSSRIFFVATNLPVRNR